MHLTSDELRSFLADDLQIDISAIADSSPLFTTGIIDSFSLISLITFIETRSGISVNPFDVSPENFDSIERIIGFVSKKRAG